MDIDKTEQAEFEVIGRAPSNPRRVIVIVGRFPRAAVREVGGCGPLGHESIVTGAAHGWH
jgi:hypothetical protein